MKDFVVELGHRPGELARVSNALSLYGVNIRTVAAMTIDGQALVHIIPDNAESARSALQADNITFEGYLPPLDGAASDDK